MGSFDVTTVNLNGVRAAVKRGFLDWIAEAAPAVLLLQEVRAGEDVTRDLLPDSWDLVACPSRIKGRAGVAIAVAKDRGALVDGSVRGVLDDAESDVDSGRWLEATVETEGERVRLVSAYFHSGEVGTPKQEAKMAHLPRIGARMGELLAEAEAPSSDLLGVVVGGDYNIVRSRADIKNWTPNHNKRAGVLDEEIAFLDEWLESGWRDVHRELAGDVQGPYTWWSWRGVAFDNDAGWRIDHQFATPALAGRASAASVWRAPSYDARFSDHAPVTVTYDL